MDKTHPEFKELYGFVYRGVGYALVRSLGRADGLFISKADRGFFSFSYLSVRR
jgi:hypothetical protein